MNNFERERPLYDAKDFARFEKRGIVPVCIHHPGADGKLWFTSTCMASIALLKEQVQLHRKAGRVNLAAGFEAIVRKREAEVAPATGGQG